ncbi:LuxR C-terminal-related transcriptional regulator [Streptomyces europaeiscabiei]|uniref:LuxR C-terminal-related transcriptional regulator n=2 Tax=Streptomyces europaeiscabiei TaxID=146819 RepID=A0ABU4N724_9ACTN|nr:helix-turn-helix transcriptional regulator [Streptomyces europaeiscabiei]MDX2523549.1 LuxR C-terminal-related transcriptional regulator [Streptomyces europaeiscabiei]MDX2764601.1 LuxR C-terminal-related transcriptional regulator [Streptomyces europaeiscabiei]MDX3541896.1 LuxR C-terminal-related transcriptional regulator [Streptomyces europaeiscabiei]MDX3550890.1 LuxR C-terminal-related transcriptional regulator [Streptomyces europaeiscabiei]MDX3665114.1 LuxR C-terminal-related transcription
MRGALARLRQATGLPLAFAGLVEPGPGQLRISELQGNRTTALQGLAVHSGNGLGGKTVALARPCCVTDYSVSRQISHEYDAAVAAEGIRSVLAVPVVVRRRVRGVLYGALRTAQPLGDRTVGAALDAARDMEQALVVRDEARNLLVAARAPEGGSAGAWEEVREAHGALRALAPRIDDPELRAELLRVCGRLAGVAGGENTGPDVVARVALTPRETDVLACVATGATNTVAGDRLGLRPETVKAYLRSAMRKLGAHTRLEAVVAARRAGLLP